MTKKLEIGTKALIDNDNDGIEHVLTEYVARINNQKFYTRFITVWLYVVAT